MTAKVNLYVIDFKKNGYDQKYQIPATSEYNAAVRLGQIYGDGKDTRDGLVIEIVSIKKAY